MMPPKWAVRVDGGLWKATGPAGRTWTGFPDQLAAITFATTLTRLQVPLTAARAAAR